MVMALTFHTEDLDSVGGALNIYIFPELSPSTESEASLLVQKWGAILGAAP